MGTRRTLRDAARHNDWLDMLCEEAWAKRRWHATHCDCAPGLQRSQLLDEWYGGFSSGVIAAAIVIALAWLVLSPYVVTP